MRTLTTIACLFGFTMLTAFKNINDSDKPGKPAPSKQVKKGWTKLFDGKTLKGWHIYRGEGTGESLAQFLDSWQKELQSLARPQSSIEQMPNPASLKRYLCAQRFLTKS